MRIDLLANVLEPWGIRPERERIDQPVSGSPERSASRHVIEDAEGRIYLLESLEPKTLTRQAEIAQTLAALSARLPEVNPYLPHGDDRFIAEREGRPWRVSRFLEGVSLVRPDYAFEAWRGSVLADFLIRLMKAARDLGLSESYRAASVFSLAGFIRDLAGKIEAKDPGLWARVRPAVARLEGDFFNGLAGFPPGFYHGDYHPMNVIWSADGIQAVIDWEFCGPKPEMYDAAVLVGCLGMEDPQSLVGDLAAGFIGGLIKEAVYAQDAWRFFFDFVVATRFAWLSDWLRRGDEEMIDLEAVYINLLIDNRAVFQKSWGLT